MSTSTPHSKLSKKTQRLTKKEKKKPGIVFQHFFDCYHLPEVKKDMWDWLVTAISADDSVYDEGISRKNLITLYEKLETLIEAAWVISR